MGIKLLPEGVWARIAAGEVVERPASAVKEMIENSLDAGARRIHVKLWDGGRIRIVVEDDGAGIAFEDLPLALMAHATSKIGSIEDLEAIHTLGYRGEALASLAAVAKVEIRSRHNSEDNHDGGMIRAHEGRILDHLRTNCAPGTRVQVDELFTNLPARRKFLKNASGELRRVAAILRDYAICRPEVSFALEHDGRAVFLTHGGGDRRRAIEQFWGAEPEIFTAKAAAGHVDLECWQQNLQGRNSQSRGGQGRNDVSAFVNGRSVTDPLVKGAVNAAARELSGNWALFFSIDPSLIDVNIHPAKAEIRFRHPGEVFEVVKEAASQLGGPLLIPDESRAEGARGANPSPSGGWDFGEPDSASDFKPSASFKSGAGGPSNEPSTDPSPARSRTSAFQAPRPDSLFGRVKIPGFSPEPQARTIPAAPPIESSANEPFLGEASFEEDEAGLPHSPELFSGSPEGVTYLGQLESGYLLFEVSDGLAVVDPHAAHERTVFERVRAAAREGRRAQNLLTPIALPPTLQLEAEEKKELLESAGFAVDSVDGALRLTAVPHFAGAAVPHEALLRGLLAALRDEGDADPTELLWRAWATMACKEAVKATTKLLPEEALVLWSDLHLCEQPFFCPHGRPTILKLSVSKLEKHFGRK
ncbi:MAG: DNA mismatch repair endonuclease MutL [Synergistaceae bacterium]|jgi:DNA mismatch repair protein MutL|nr:DNA mismatch repair endonuclease MutL [Synergistaceae bacterium]